MWTETLFWIFVGLIVCWMLLDPVARLFIAIGQLLTPVLFLKEIELEKKFGKWAVITGATDGIGKEYAKELGARGLNLVLISRTQERLEKTRSEVLEKNPNIEVKIIVADFARGRDTFVKIEAELKDIEVGILVNNVGKQYSYPMYLGEVPESELWDIINVNVGATTLMTRTVIEGMKKRRKGAIVNISSGSEFLPLPLMTVYAATKVYIRSFSEALRAEYSQFGLTIQHLTPLFVNTKMNAFSPKLQVSSVFVPDALTYAKNAVSTLGKVNTSTGYWAHGIQNMFVLVAPMYLRIKIGHYMNQILRNDYFKKQKIST